MRATSADAAEMPVKPRMPATTDIRKNTSAHLRSVTAHASAGVDDVVHQLPASQRVPDAHHVVARAELPGRSGRMTQIYELADWPLPIRFRTATLRQTDCWGAS